MLPRVAQLLLTDITARLEHQHNICCNLREAVEKIGSYPRGSVSSRPTREVDNEGRANLIRTSEYLTPYWWRKETDNQKKTSKKKAEVMKKAFKTIEDLEVLHNDTHSLCLNLSRSLDTPQQLSSTNQKFLIASTLKQVYDRHALVVENLAELVISVRAQVPKHDKVVDDLHQTVEHFLRGRYGVQLLCKHYDLLDKGTSSGVISEDCSIRDVVDDAIADARFLCEAHFMTSPPVLVFSAQQDPVFPIVRQWLYFSLVELIKNAMAVSVKNLGCLIGETGGESEDEETDLPPIQIHIDDKDDGFLVIRIEDQGGGLPESVCPSDLFVFAQKERLWDRLDDQTTYAQTRSPLQGLGSGLSLSRLALQHFGGTVELQTQEKCQKLGCVAIIRINLDMDHLESY